MAEKGTKVVRSAGNRPPRAGMGRPKGVPNKVTTLAKEAIAMAADGLGGVPRLIAWAQEDPGNEKAFWTQMYTKLVPLQVGADPNAPLAGVVLVPMKAPTVE